MDHGLAVQNKLLSGTEAYETRDKYRPVGLCASRKAFRLILESGIV